MGAFTKAEIEEALQSIISIIVRAEKAREKFVRGTPQYTLQENRIKALYAAASLLSRELGNSEALDGYGKKTWKCPFCP